MNSYSVVDAPVVEFATSEFVLPIKYAVYSVIGEPPFKLGVDQVALTLLPLTVTVGAEGAEGTDGVDEAAKSTGSDDPSELFATILNVYSVESDKPVIVVEVSVLDKFLVATPLAVTV